MRMDGREWSEGSGRGRGDTTLVNLNSGQVLEKECS